MAEKPNHDWTGNSQSSYAMIGASNHALEYREQDDFYSTDPDAIEVLFKHVSFSDKIWECACGNGALSKRMEKLGKQVKSTDLVDRGYGVGGVNFLSQTEPFDGDIITNPPYKYVTEFVLKAIELTQDKVAMFLKLTTLEGRERYEKIFKPYPPKDVYVFINRMMCFKSDAETAKSSAVCFAWFIWQKGYNGLPTIHWISTKEIETNQTKLF